MNFAKRYPILGSSKDPEKISLTIKSIGIALIPLIVAVGRMFDVDLIENDLVRLITALASIVSIIGASYGIIRKYTM